MTTAVEQMSTALAERSKTAIAPPAANPLASAREAEARATVEARYLVAFKRPRDWDEVRQKMMKECSRPAFARDKSALYRKPVGQGVEGLGIRFAEMALRCMTNMMTEAPVIYEDDIRRVIRVIVTNLEDNQTETGDVTVSKTVERSKPLDDGSFLSVRKNSYGKPTYLVPATDEDLLNKEWALVSKMRRNCVLRHVPADIQEEAETIIRKVRQDEAAKDPDADRREIIDGFARLNVPVTELTEYVGHDLGTCSPAELADLRTVWGSVRDGEATWASMLEFKRAERAQPKEPESKEPKAPSKGVEGAKERAEKKPAPKMAPEELRKALVKAKEEFANCKDIEALNLCAESYEDDVRAHEEFAAAYSARLKEFAESAVQPDPKAKKPGTPKLRKEYVGKMTDAKSVDKLDEIFDLTRGYIWGKEDGEALKNTYDNLRAQLAK